MYVLEKFGALFTLALLIAVVLLNLSDKLTSCHRSRAHKSFADIRSKLAIYSQKVRVSFKLSKLLNELKRLEKSTVSIVCLCGSMITALTNLSTAPIGTVAKAEWLFEA